MHYRLIVFALVSGFLTKANAQSPSAAYDHYDQKIEYFSEHHQQDSFLYYAAQKIQRARQNNNLTAWTETYVDIQYFFHSDHNTALKYLEEALAKKWREPADTAEWEPFFYVFALKGYRLTQLGQIWPAVQAYETANELYERYHFPDFDAVDGLYKPLGNHYTRLGDNEKALAVFQKALAVGGEPEVLAGLYGNIGIACWNQGNMPPAEDNCRRGLELHGISKAKRALLQSTLALVQLDSGHPALAGKTATQALQLLPNPSPGDLQRFEDRARIRRSAGLAFARTGQYATALHLLDGALSDARRASGNHGNRDIGKIELAFSECFLHQRQPQKALDAANRALSAVLPGFMPLDAAINPDPTGFYEENTIFEALIAKADAADALFKQSGEIRWLKLALDCHDLAHQAEMRLRAIYQYDSSKLGLQSDARSREEAAMAIARTLYEKTGSPEYRNRGFEIAERSKASLLLDALRANLLRQQFGNNPQFKTLAGLRQTAAWYNKQLILEPQNEQAGAWRSALDELTGKINALKNSIPGIGRLEEAAAGMAAPASPRFSGDEMLVEYFVGEQFTEFFVGTGSTITAWYRFKNEAALQQQLQGFQRFFADGNAILNDPVGYLQTAYGLWQKLLPQDVANAPKLLLIPDGFLNFIPFEALVRTAPDEKTTLNNAAYLIRNQQIRYAWSLQTLQGQDALQSQAGSFFLGLAPVFEYGQRGLAPLPGSRQEWREIAHSALTELNGPMATTANFLAAAGNHRVLHLSTHAFAGSSPRIELFDQALLLLDIYALPLQADLVVLSACETGIGTDQKGEGVMSLARAFAQAGAACVVSSLWTVNDQTTGLLFRQFYRNLEAHQTIAAALRQAKLDYLGDGDIAAMQQSPYFWAGLVEVGSERDIKMPDRPFSWFPVVMVFFLLLTLLLFGYWWKR